MLKLLETCVRSAPGRCWPVEYASIEGQHAMALPHYSIHVGFERVHRGAKARKSKAHTARRKDTRLLLPCPQSHCQAAVRMQTTRVYCWGSAHVCPCTAPKLKMENAKATNP